LRKILFPYGPWPCQYVPIGSRAMSVARVTEISATSPQSFEDAIKQGIDRANQTLRHVKSAWVKEQQVNLDDGKIVNYQVNLAITFVLEDTANTTSS
jgi:dodecin